MKTLKKTERRGVSPVIATLLLIVIAVAAAVLVYMWTVGYATQMKPTTPETGERLKIEAGKLYVSGSDVMAELHVRNVGGSPTYINASYLLTTAQDVIDVAVVKSEDEKTEIRVDDTNAYGTSLAVGNVYTVTVKFTDAAGSVTVGQTYIVRIVTSLGNEFAIELKLRPSA